jgi:hypothetical protein
MIKGNQLLASNFYELIPESFAQRNTIVSDIFREWGAALTQLNLDEEFQN